MGLKIKVVKKATKTGNCGGVDYQVKWVLEPGDTGYVIQRIERSHEVLKCDDKADPDLTGAKFCSGADAPTFWEAWRVDNGKVFVGTSDTPHSADTYLMLDHEKRKKKHKTDGKVQFVPNYALTIDGQDGWKKNDIPSAGALPTTKTQPTGWTADASRDHNVSVEWNCCVEKPGQPTITSDPSESDEGAGETIIKTIPVEASTAAKRAATLIQSMPSWMEASAKQQAYNALFTRLKRLDALHSDVVRGGVEIYIDQSKRGKSYSVPAQSKLYLLNRYLFRLPRFVVLGQFPFFGGWDIPVDGERFSPSWPFVVKPSGLVLEGAFSGYYGDEYMALDEFDYFRQMYRRRKPPTS